MKVLVIGSGGREHALVKSFSESASVEKVFACPGNAGMSQQAIVLTHVAVTDHLALLQFCQVEKIDFVFIGPEEPLVNGLSDILRSAGIPVVGPSQKAAQLEGSKIFAKQFMQKSHVATADAVVVESVQETLTAAQQYSKPYILKADGLAGGKGVFICDSIEELQNAAEDLFVHQKLGLAGKRALLEKNLPGTELSFLIITNGTNFQALPLAQDHKRLLNQNKGPNTGGMGTVAPLQIPPSLYTKIIKKIIEPSVEGLKNHHLLFRGILFVGVMVVNDEPYALEYNVRFGDPETQVILPLLKNDVAELFFELANGNVQKIELNHLNAFCIVNAAAGYPDQPQKNAPIVLPNNEAHAYVLHAATRFGSNNELVSNGGRVLNVVAIDADRVKARQKAYALNEKIQFAGRQFRTDLGDYQFQRNDN